MKTYVLEREQIIHRSKAETFAFFCDAWNLEQITPPFLRFRIMTPRPVVMKKGALIDYQLSLFAIPFRWRTRIEQWSPNDSFVDLQIQGPYALWHHTHTFTSLGPDKTLMRDRVEYRIPMGIFGRIAHALFVRRTLQTIFDYRAAMTAKLLNESVAAERKLAVAS
jgi:hypothetical protein